MSAIILVFEQRNIKPIQSVSLVFIMCNTSHCPSKSQAFSYNVCVCLCLVDMIRGDQPKGEQTLPIPHGCTVSHRLFPLCVCVVSLEQEIIRFKPQRRRIKGEGEEDGGKKGGGVLCRVAEGEGERAVIDRRKQRGSFNEGK